MTTTHRSGFASLAGLIAMVIAAAPGLRAKARNRSRTGGQSVK